MNSEILSAVSDMIVAASAVAGVIITATYQSTDSKKTTNLEFLRPGRMTDEFGRLA